MILFLLNSLIVKNMQLELLNKINSPADIRNYSKDELNKLVDELRFYIIKTISEIGGHLAPTLGVIELTVALHKVFETPKDKIVWDVGHQGYAHKLLTGRFDRFNSIRQFGGLSGFLKRSESEYDVFGAGHASTSISAATGIAQSQKHSGKDFRVVSVIGDGSMTGGLAFEALNNAGHLKTPMILVLNDNEMSISPNVGALNNYLTKIVTNPTYNRIREEIWNISGKLPFGKSQARTILHRLEDSLKSLLVPGMLFEELGFRYIGPVDGHNLSDLIDTFEKIKDISDFSRMQQIQINSTIKNLEHIDKGIIKSFISKVSYPISYFDFETYSEPIPIHYDQKPNERIPFQYSLHIQKSPGDSVDSDGGHFEFLANHLDDPRREIAESIIRSIPDEGSIITYHQTFEKSVIKDLAEFCPDLSNQLLDLNKRILDLKDPFSEGGYYHPDFGGSFSIKKVLPALFKDNEKLDYKSLSISNGGMASNTFRNLKNISADDVELIRKDLLEYCWLDTYAMFAIYEKLLLIYKS